MTCLTPQPSSADIKHGCMYNSASLSSWRVMGKLHLFTHSIGGPGPRAGLDALGFKAQIAKTTAYTDYVNLAPPTREN